MRYLLAIVLLLTGCVSPVDLLSESQRTTDLYFNAIEAVQSDEIISCKLGMVEWVLYTSDRARVAEYERRHKVTPGNWYGVCWAAGTSDRLDAVEFWVPAKRLKNGHLVVHPGVCRHEETHAIEWILKQRRIEADPDLYVSEKFYR